MSYKVVVIEFYPGVKHRFMNSLCIRDMKEIINPIIKN